MKVPGNVLRFEVLLYISLMLDTLSVALADRTQTSENTDSMIMAQAFFNVAEILLFVYFVNLAARHRKNWPRWVMLAALVLSGVWLVLFLGDKGMTLDAGIEIISCVLTSLGLYYSVSGDARGWFNA
jgi:protein-S-isoprenylcysteine O-methyltransferase Ste14